MEAFAHHPQLNLRGLSITLPHKENALRYLKEHGAHLEALASRLGVVNTITLGRTGKMVAFSGINTDYSAIVDSICAGLNISPAQLATYRVAVLGAGGAGRAAVAAMAHLGATVVVHNRTFERAEALAKEFNGHTGQVVAARWEKLCQSCCQIYINTTSVGMHPKMDESPFGDAPPALGPDTLVFDTIYNPPRTRLLHEAQARGARTISGVEMFVRQAAAQFTTWTGNPAPAEVMRQEIERRLGAKP
jgi:3-dehydroquinate dehydratase/shikimate dehydrogenase